MHFLHVLLQVAFDSERSRTHVTHEITIARMNNLMCFQVRFLRESAVAKLTLEYVLTGVCVHVSVDAGHFSESLVAHITRQRILLVQLHVPSEIPSNRVDSTTDVAFHLSRLVQVKMCVCVAIQL